MHLKKKISKDPPTVAPKNPWSLFQTWWNEVASSKLREPAAMALATVDSEGVPTIRTVLLKSFGRRGFIFFTNYKSRKGKDVAVNKKAALLFYWDFLHRQVRVTGRVVKVSKKESDRYFAARPYLSQISAWVSPQSEKIPSREWLEVRMGMFQRKFRENHVPRPKYWGGYRLEPKTFEFWIGKKNRLHDRFLYERKGNRWLVSRLAP